uniref:Uncharacterized protein n=1 Tax=Arundo donax TaxID=35708 RepID=A0A0A8ZC59_ARUDO
MFLARYELLIGPYSRMSQVFDIFLWNSCQIGQVHAIELCSLVRLTCKPGPSLCCSQLQVCSRCSPML